MRTPTTATTTTTTTTTAGRETPRRRTLLLLAAVLLVAALAAAGCGEEMPTELDGDPEPSENDVGEEPDGDGADGPDDDSDRSDGGATEAADAWARLHVDISHGETGDAHTVEVACEQDGAPLGGTDAAACDVVDDEADWLREGPDPDRVCTQQYGGPQEAEIRGEIGGEPVEVSVHRRDGCGISDWDRLEALLGPPTQ